MGALLLGRQNSRAIGRQGRWTVAGPALVALARIVHEIVHPGSSAVCGSTGYQRLGSFVKPTRVHNIARREHPVGPVRVVASFLRTTRELLESCEGDPTHARLRRFLSIVVHETARWWTALPHGEGPFWPAASWLADIYVMQRTRRRRPANFLSVCFTVRNDGRTLRRVDPHLLSPGRTLLAGLARRVVNTA